MGFDVSKARDEGRVLDLDAALDRRLPYVAESVVGAHAAEERLVGFSAAQDGRSLADGVLASSRASMRLVSPFLPTAAGILALDTLEAFGPGGAYARGISAFVNNAMLEPRVKLGSLAVAESQASAALNASTARTIAGSFRSPGPLGKQARCWHSIHDGVLGGTVAKQVAGMEQTLGNQYAGSFIQLKKALNSQFGNIGRQVVQGFLHPHESQLRATLDAFNQSQSDAIRRFAAGYVGLAQRVGELFEALRPRFDGAFEWLRREMERWPRDPYGNLVPVWNVRLYRLAQAAYEGDYVARARFLDEIGADGSPDNVLMIGELLKPSFNPERPDLRVDWEQMDPAGARRWLRRRLDGLRLSAWKEEQKRKNGEQPYEAESQAVETITFDVPEFEFVEVEIREDERALYEQLRGVLPERQYLFCWYRAQGLKYEEIAAKMGIALGTVKAHALLLKRNPSFLEVLGL